MSAAGDRPSFSLVVATRGRAEVLARLLDSLAGQVSHSFEVVVADQNADDRVTGVLERYGHRLDIRHLRCDPGQSAARNDGIRRARGCILAFPDDDCWYPEGLLHRVHERFSLHNGIGALTGRLVDRNGGADASVRFDHRPGEVTRANVWRRGCAATLFVRSEAAALAGGFDPELGLGSGTPWEAAEEIDFVTALVDRGLRVLYDPAIVVGHPSRSDLGWRELSERARRYGRGIGRVWRKRRFAKAYVAYHMLVRPLGGCVLSLITGRAARARYHGNALRGRWEGWTGRVQGR